MHYEFNIDLKPVWHKPPPPIKEPYIRKSLVLAYQIEDFMLRHKIESLTEFSHRANITPTRTTQIMRMLQLAPSIQADILLAGDKKLFKLRERHTRRISKEPFWPRQEELWKDLMSHH